MEFDFNFDPVWKHKDVLGLDIGSKFIKVVQLRKKKNLVKLVGYGKIEVPENYIIEGIVSEPEKLAEVIKDLIKNKVWGEITATRVNTSLPESKIFTRVLTLPKMNEKEIEEAVTWEASQSVPMAITDLYLDWKIIGPSEIDPKNVEVIFAAAPKAIVNSYLQLFKTLGFEPFSIETSLSAIIRAMIPTKHTKETLMVIDLGGNSTNLAIFDHVIRVTGSILVGGDDVTQKVAIAAGVDEAEAQKLKKSKNEEQIVKIREAVDSELTEITKEADRIINYYSEKVKKDKPISKVFVCGGEANIPHLTDFVSEKLGVPAEIGNPWVNISIYPIKPVPKSEAPSYTNAVGLALVGLEND